jgi:DNA-binding transcriptional regulator GbsR (MarR family)
MSWSLDVVAAQFESGSTSALSKSSAESISLHFLLKFTKPPSIFESMPAFAELAPRQKSSELTPLEVESIEMFINFLRQLGWPKSVGEIYGLLFVSAQPLAMDDIMARVGISLGAASQGLKLLREFGAIRTVYMPGERKDHYVASGELSRFATSFIENELLPRMHTAQQRIKRMEKMMESLHESDRQLPTERIDRLKYWLGKGQKVVPWLVRFLKL